MNRKVTVVGGAGNVGATVARGIADKQLADVVVIDIADKKAAGIALDILEACPVYGSDARVMGSGDYADSANSDIVVVTSGMPRKPGMSRDDLLNVNYKIMETVTTQVVKHSPNCILIVVSNPLDAMAQAVHKLSKFPRERVIGMAGVLDSARMRSFIAKELNVSVDNVHAFVLGGHGDTMVPLPRYSSVAGIPIPDLIRMGWTSQTRIDALVHRPRDGGAEIVNLLKTGSAFYAPASSGIAMAESYLRDRKRVLPCAAFLNGEYGVKDMYVGVPVVIGSKGVERVVEIELAGKDREAFDKSVGAVQGLVDACKKIAPDLLGR